MRDELFDRDYQHGRAELHQGLDQIIRLIAQGLAGTFDAIHRVEWSAPWRGHVKDDCAGLA